MSRYCERCGSDDLRWVAVGPDYWRKECAACGSTGAFVVDPTRSRYRAETERGEPRRLVEPVDAVFTEELLDVAPASLVPRSVSAPIHTAGRYTACEKEGQ